MRFEYLSRDLWAVALRTAKHFAQRGYSVRGEKKALEGHGFHPTLVCRKSWEVIAIEVNSVPTTQGPFWDFVRMALAAHAELAAYVALPRQRNGDEILLPVSFLDEVRGLGVRLLLVTDDDVQEKEKAARCSLRFSVPPGRSFGRHKDQVLQAISKFNRGDNIDGLRDLTEIIEDALHELATKAAAKRLIVPTAREVGEMDFEGMINVLAAPEWRGTPQRRFLDENLKNDLKSFKGARNLGHHPRNRKQQRNLENQFMERTQASVRLLREILTQIDRCNRAQAPAPVP